MKKRNRGFLIFLSCVLGVPTVGALVGELQLSADAALAVETLRPWLAVGTLLGIAHLFVRPILRIFSAPLGCMTLGLFGLVIDVGLIYLCTFMIRDFAFPNPITALLTALLINTIAAVTGARK